LREINAAVTEMVAETHHIFTHLRNKQQAEAGKRMATMDRKFAYVNTTLVRLRERIGAIQKEHFEQQTAAASSLQKFEYLIAALILLMVGGATVYGQRIARQVRSDVQEKDRFIEALRHSEEELRRARDELEEKVKQRTAELEHAAEVRTRLLEQVMTAQEDERRRIARDLHDEVGQSLTSLLIGFRAVQESPTIETARNRVEQLRQIAGLTLAEVQRLARGLRPSVLDDLGFEAALERYVADYSDAHGIDVDLHSSGPARERLPGAVETALYRIVQEALNNTAKHAGAKNVAIGIERQAGLVRVLVGDDGHGFDVSAGVAGPGLGGGLGLSGMNERAALLNGSVTVDSGPGRGTRIIVCIPLKEDSRGQDSRAAGG
jgi:signal transduction histidine kinase